jgi:hypothetical protein
MMTPFAQTDGKASKTLNETLGQRESMYRYHYTERDPPNAKVFRCRGVV